MHGTFVNGNRLAPDVPTELQDGDHIILGAEVRRGRETFPACAFDLAYRLTKFKKTFDYGLPDPSDMEDEGFEFSDMEDEAEHNSNDGLSVASSRPQLSQSSKMIDLTQDDSDQSSTHSGEFTHVSETKVDTEEVVMAADSFESFTDVVQNSKARTPIDIVSDLDGEESEAEESGNDRSDVSDDDRSDRSIKSADGDEPSVDDEEDSEASSEDDSESVIDYTRTEHEYDRVGTSEHYIKFDKNAEVPSSVVYDQDLDDGDSLADSGIGQNETETSGPLPSIRDHLETLRSYDVPHSYLLETVAAEFEDDVESASQVIETLASAASIYDRRAPRSHEPFHHRAPSPSDFVLAKPAQRQTATIKPSDLQHGSKALGAGTGKEDYFKAREVNKAAFKQNEIAAHGQVEERKQSSKFLENRRILKLKFKAPYKSPSERVNTKSDLDEILDISSTKVNEAITDATANEVQKQVGIHRPNIRINDIINRSTPDITIRASKRKAEEISTTLEEEVRAWASSPSSPPVVKSAEKLAPLMKVFTGEPSPQQVSVERPQKRLRMVLEKVGYAALGGVAVGAALFGSLVATAPEFV